MSTTTQKPISRQQASKRLMDIEHALHALIRDCGIAGYTEAADALDYVVSYCFDPAYDALGKRTATHPTTSTNPRTGTTMAKTFTLTFRSDNAATVLGSMAEGMEEVQRDDDNVALADALNALAQLIWQREDGQMVLIVPEALRDAADCALENCLDNSSGMDREDEETEDFIFAGDVVVSG